MAREKFERSKPHVNIGTIGPKGSSFMTVKLSLILSKIVGS